MAELTYTVIGAPPPAAAPLSAVMAPPPPPEPVPEPVPAEAAPTPGPLTYTVLDPASAAAAAAPAPTPGPVPGPLSYTVISPPGGEPGAAAPMATQPAGALAPYMDVQPPADTGEGLLSGLFAGGRAAFREGVQTVQGRALTIDPNAPAEPAERGWFNELGYGIGHAAPTIAAGLGGAGLGAVFGGPPGAIVGGGLGVGLASFAQDIAPTYAAAIQNGMPHEEAVRYAIKHAAVTGAVSGGTAYVPWLARLPGAQTVIGNILYQAFVGQPISGAAVRVGVPAAMGEPIPSASQLVRGYGQDVATGAAFAGVHAARGLVRRPEAPTPPPPPGGEETAAPPPPPPPAAPTTEAAPPAAPTSLRIEGEPTPPVGGEVTRAPAAGEPAATTPVVETTPAGHPGEEPAPTVPVTEPTARPGEAPPVGEPTPPAGEPPAETRPPGEAAPAARAPGTEETVAPETAGRAPATETVTPTPGEAAAPTVAAAAPEGAAAAPTEEAAAPAKRPVTKEELDRLNNQWAEAERKVLRAEHLGQPDDVIQKLREQAQAAKDAATQAEGPPTKISYLRGTKEEYDAREAQHQAAVAAHEEAVDARVHNEGTTPVPEPSAAGRVFNRQEMGEAANNVVQGPDNAGNHWAGNGNVLIRGVTAFTRAVAQTLKQKTSVERTVPPNAIDKVTTPSAKVQPVTWERQVSPPGQTPVVIGTRPDGTHIALKKPIFDALHAAAGTDGSFVVDTDGRVFARNAAGEHTGVGMMINYDQAKLRTWARGPGAEAPAETPARARRGRARQDMLADTGVIEERAPGEAPRAEPITPREDLFSERAAVPETGPGTTAEAAPTTPVETPAFTPSKQLQALMNTRDQLAAKPDRTPAENTKLAQLGQQIDKKLQAEERAAERRGGKKLPFSGPPEVGKPRDFHDYKFNDGTSVYNSVFEEAGHDPNRMVNRPLAVQKAVLTQHLQNKFGFRSIDIVSRGKVDDHIAIQHMLDATRAMSDMMAASGLPHTAASLGGRLKLVIEPEGKRPYYGAYVPAEGEIRVMANANSFGHEWTHALDHELAQRFTGNPTLMNKLLSQYTRESGLNVGDNVQAAFAKLINTMVFDEGALAARRLQLETTAAKTDAQGKPTKAAIEAKAQLAKLEAGGTQLRIQPSEFRAGSAQLKPASYWASVYEMLARAHEAYISHVMENAAVDPRGVVMPSEAYTNETVRQLKLAYPKQGDRDRIFAAFDELHQALRNEQILSGGKPAGDFGNYGISDPHYYPKTAPVTSKTAVGGVQTRTVNAYRNFTKNLKAASPFDPARPGPGAYKAATWLADGWRAVGFSGGGILKTIIARSPPASRPFLQAIADRLTPRPGTGAYTGESMEEEMRAQSRVWTERYANTIADNGLAPERMTPKGGLMLRHAMLTGDDRMPIDPLDPSKGTEPIPYNIVKAAGELRPLMNEIWRWIHNTGIDIGYAEQYFPRMYDKAAIYADSAKFHDAAATVYKLMFDREVGAPGSDPGALLEKWNKLGKAGRELAAGRYPGLDTGMTELRANLRRQAAIEKNPNPTPAEQAELAQLKTDAEDLARAHHDDLGNHVAAVSAEDWYQRIQGSGRFAFDQAGGSTQFLRTRELPAEADHYLRDFMHAQPNDAIPHYMHAAARRGALVRRFGAKQEELDTLLREASKRGVRGEDIEWFRDTVEKIFGHVSGNAPPALMGISNVLHAFGALVTMPRAAWSGLAEPMAASLATGEFRTGFKIFASQFGQVFRTLNAQQATEAAHVLGVITSSMNDSAMLSRLSADYSDRPALNKLMTLYYRVTGLTQLVNSQRIGAVSAGTWYLGKLSRLLLDTGTDFAAKRGRDDAGRWLNELGIPTRLHEDFANWILQQGGIPNIDTITGDPMGAAYGLAIRRLSDRMIQEPYKFDRAMATSQPLLALPFQLMSFNYAFQKNVLNPLWDRIEHRYGFAKLESEARGAGPVGARLAGVTAAGGSMVHMATLVGSMISVGLMTTMMRQLLFAPDQWDQHEKDGTLGDYLLDLAFQRSGLNGVMDPIVQLFSHLRYQADLSSLMDGASINWIRKNAQDVLTPFLTTNDSPNTNTRMFNQVRGFTNLIGVPLAAVGLTMLGSAGGPVVRAAAGAALQYGTSPGTVTALTEAQTGFKGATLPKEGEGLPGLAGGPEELPGLPTEKDETNLAAGGGLTGPWGLVDDVAIPMWRYGSQALNRLPTSLKLGTLGAGAAYQYWQMLQDAAPFRDLPRPEKP